MKLPFETKDRTILIKREAQTDPQYGKYPEQRSIQELLDNGIICVNKFSGPTSHQVTDTVRRILEIKKAGHGGTIDPAVTGVLPVGLGKATRILDTFLESGKEYICVMHIHEEKPLSLIHKTAKSLVGTITQFPPVRSAVKRQNRQRIIYYLNILEIKGRNVLFKVGCEAGTYIRTLCLAFGKAMNTEAHMAQLIRTKAGSFTDQEWKSLHDIKDAYEAYKSGNELPLRNVVHVAERGVQHLMKIWISDTTVDTLCHGADLSIPGIVSLEQGIEKQDLVAIFTLKNELVALGRAELSAKEIQELPKGKAVKTTKVLMEPNTYPKFVKK